MIYGVICSVTLLTAAYIAPHYQPTKLQAFDGVCIVAEKLDFGMDPNMCISSCLRGVKIEKTCRKLVKIGSINADDPAKYKQYFGESFSMAQWAVDKFN